MSKRTDVTYGRRGGRLVPTEDIRPLLEQIDELRQKAGGSFTPEPAPADDGQLELFGGRRMIKLVRIGPGMYVDPASGTLHIDAAEVCDFFEVDPSPENCEVVERQARQLIGDVPLEVREDAREWRQ